MLNPIEMIKIIFFRKSFLYLEYEALSFLTHYKHSCSCKGCLLYFLNSVLILDNNFLQIWSILLIYLFYLNRCHSWLLAYIELSLIVNISFMIPSESYIYHTWLSFSSKWFEILRRIIWIILRTINLFPISPYIHICILFF